MKETEQTLLEIPDIISSLSIPSVGPTEFAQKCRWLREQMDLYATAKAQASCEAKWISVKDRLPEFHQRVMISFIVELTGDVLLKVDYCFKYHNNDVEWKHTDSKSVTHWQPLPSAPTLQGREPGRDSLQFTDPKNIIIL